MEQIVSTQSAVGRIICVIYIDCEVLDGGKLPAKAHDTDAGFDLFATNDMHLAPGSVAKHPLNIKLSLPEGTYMEICTKSGLGSKGMLVFAGIVDQDYRGIPHVICTMLTPGVIQIDAGMKIAQGIIHPHGPYYVMRQVTKIDENTSRGAGGFGSSGS
jgi:dUTP pyrophosphatase